MSALMSMDKKLTSAVYAAVEKAYDHRCDIEDAADEILEIIKADRKRRGDPSKCPECSDPDLSPEKHWQDGYDDGVAAALRRGEPVADTLTELQSKSYGGAFVWLGKHSNCQRVTESMLENALDPTITFLCKTRDAALAVVRKDAEAPQPAEPVSQHPDDAAVDAFAVTMKAKLKRARAMLREHVEKGDPVDMANLAMMLSLNGQRIVLAEPVKSHLKVSYDDKYDVLYVDCDSNEPTDAEEDDKGILYRRAISDGRLIGITVMNFMGPHAESRYGEGTP